MTEPDGQNERQRQQAVRLTVAKDGSGDYEDVYKRQTYGSHSETVKGPPFLRTGKRSFSAWFQRWQW